MARSPMDPLAQVLPPESTLRNATKHQLKELVYALAEELAPLKKAAREAKAAQDAAKTTAVLDNIRPKKTTAARSMAVMAMEMALGGDNGLLKEALEAMKAEPAVFFTSTIPDDSKAKPDMELVQASIATLANLVMATNADTGEFTIENEIDGKFIINARRIRPGADCIHVTQDGKTCTRCGCAV